MKRPLTDYRALTFDCYGTLIDWESGIWDAFQPVLVANARSDIVRAPALEAFAGFESEHEVRSPGAVYPEILASVHHDLAVHFGLDSTAALDGRFAASVPMWPAFADTADALRSLAVRYELVILSNIDRDGFAASNRKLGVRFDAIYTAEDIGSYKPDPANFEYLMARLDEDLGIGTDEVLHVAQSLFHDHVPAIEAGLSTAWIDRPRLSQGGDWGATATVVDRPQVDYLFFSMAELAAAVRVGD